MAEITLRIPLHEKQKLIYSRGNAQVVIARCGRKFGKSRGSRYRVGNAINNRQSIAYVAPEYTGCNEPR